MGSLAKGFLAERFEEILWKARGNLQNMRFIASGKGGRNSAEVAEIFRKSAEMIL